MTLDDFPLTGSFELDGASNFEFACDRTRSGTPDFGFVFSAPESSWYTFESKLIDNDVTRGVFGTALSLASGECETTLLTCNQNFGGETGHPEYIQIFLEVGETVTLVIEPRHLAASSWPPSGVGDITLAYEIRIEPSFDPIHEIREGEILERFVHPQTGRLAPLPCSLNFHTMSQLSAFFDAPRAGSYLFRFVSMGWFTWGGGIGVIIDGNPQDTLDSCHEFPESIDISLELAAGQRVLFIVETPEDEESSYSHFSTTVYSSELPSLPLLLGGVASLEGVIDHESPNDIELDCDGEDGPDARYSFWSLWNAPEETLYAFEVRSLDGSPPPGISISANGESLICSCGNLDRREYLSSALSLILEDDQEVTVSIEPCIDGAPSEANFEILVDIDTWPSVNWFAPIIELPCGDLEGAVQSSYRFTAREAGTFRSRVEMLDPTAPITLAIIRGGDYRGPVTECITAVGSAEFDLELEANETIVSIVEAMMTSATEPPQRGYFSTERRDP